MRASLLVLGLVFIAAGFASAFYGASFRVKNVEYERVVGSSSNSWEVSGNLSARARMVLKLAPGRNWWLWFEPWQGTDFPIQAYYREIYVTIIDPNGGQTNITLYYVKAGEQNAVFFGAVVNSNDGGLEMEGDWIIAETKGVKYYNYHNKFCAITKYTGLYRVIITNGYEFGSQPTSFEIIEQKLREDRPYFFLIPVGVPIVAIGTVVLYMSRKSKRKTRKTRSAHG